MFYPNINLIIVFKQIENYVIQQMEKLNTANKGFYARVALQTNISQLKIHAMFLKADVVYF